MADATEEKPQRKERPLIGVSRCLLGEPVRYDGQASRVSWIVDILSEHCEFLPLCPELEAGFGVPRPPIRLQHRADGIAVVLVENPAEDRTARLEAACTGLLASINTVDGLILKARSPSCALHDAPIFDQTGSESGRGAGVFAAQCLRHYPGLPVVDERALESEAGRIGFLVQVYRFCCRRRV